MAIRSSVLAWRIPGTGEPGGLPSMGLHRVGHDWSDLAAAANRGNVRDVGLISGLGRSPAGGHGNPFHYSCLWTEKPGGLQSMGLQSVRHEWRNLACMQTRTETYGTCAAELWAKSPNWYLSSVCEFPFVQKLLLLSILNLSSYTWSHSIQCSFLKSLS